MKVGDLVRKRWGRIDSYQQNTLAIVVNPHAITEGLLLTGPLVAVAYPGRSMELHKPEEFEVINESR